MDALAAFYFHQGTNTHAYEYLGCHRMPSAAFSYVFRVWAPNAREVRLVGDFLSWDQGVKMENIDGGVYETVVCSAVSLHGQAYKFFITGKDGIARYKADPYAAFSKGKEDGASIIVDTDPFLWQDDAWLAERKEKIALKEDAFLPCPFHVYEVHAESFMRHEDGSVLTYRELADILVPYVKYLGYTHIEFLPLAEYPFDGSWGYQIGGFFAPSSRFGFPDDFRYFINACHTAGVGVLLDWVPAHFPKDGWGLYEFDGQPLYEYQGQDRMESPWGTRYFDLGREEIQSFLISNALYWLREFHVDGLRVDAVASMLYLDFDRLPGEWVPNVHGGRENLEAIAFLKKLNASVLGEIPDACMIAEESTDFPGVTTPVSEGGLGFTMKWNMGWANDMYLYVATNPVLRKGNHHALTFPLMYAFSENYILPVSHDEVVHGKKSLLDKMFGSYEDKFRQLRVFLLLQMTYPGKKMHFMGTEIAPFREWDYAGALEWFMLEYPKHRAMRDYTVALNHFYLSHPQLWTYDFSPKGFSWICPDEANKNMVAFERKDGKGRPLTVLLSFSGTDVDVLIPVKKGQKADLLFSSDDTFVYREEFVPEDGQPYLRVQLPPFCGIVLDIHSKRKQLLI